MVAIFRHPFFLVPLLILQKQSWAPDPLSDFSTGTQYNECFSMGPRRLEISLVTWLSTLMIRAP